MIPARFSSSMIFAALSELVAPEPDPPISVSICPFPKTAALSPSARGSIPSFFSRTMLPPAISRASFLRDSKVVYLFITIPFFQLNHIRASDSFHISDYTGTPYRIQQSVYPYYPAIAYGYVYIIRVLQDDGNMPDMRTLFVQERHLTRPPNGGYTENVIEKRSV